MSTVGARGAASDAVAGSAVVGIARGGDGAGLRRRRARAADERVRRRRQAVRIAGRRVPAAGIVLGPPGSGQLVGATEYGGPGDPSSGVRRLLGGEPARAQPDSYAELGGDTFQTATAMGGLPYMTPLRITWGSARRSPTSATSGSGAARSTDCRACSTCGGSSPAGSASRTRTGCGRARCGSSGRRRRAPATCWGRPRRRDRRRPAADRRRSTAAQDPAACAPAPAEGVPLDGRPARAAAAERARRGAGGRPARGQGDHRRRQPDRRQAVPVRRRPRAPAVRDRARVRLLEQRRAPALRRAGCCRSTTTRPRARSSRSGSRGPGGG